jgi:hypothetical protein
MNRKSIEILIEPSGELKIDAVSFTGADCEKATAFLEQALGQINARQRKPEWHRHIRRTTRLQAGG